MGEMGHFSTSTYQSIPDHWYHWYHEYILNCDDGPSRVDIFVWYGNIMTGESGHS